MDIAGVAFDVETTTMSLFQVQQARQALKRKPEPTDKRMSPAKSIGGQPRKRPKAKTAPKCKGKHKRNEQGEIDSVDVPLEKVTHWEWASRFKKRVAEKGIGVTYNLKEVNVFTEFTGSTCAESAIESVVNNLPDEQKRCCIFISGRHQKELQRCCNAHTPLPQHHVVRLFAFLTL
jgi:hypothetical protein